MGEVERSHISKGKHAGAVIVSKRAFKANGDSCEAKRLGNAPRSKKGQAGNTEKDFSHKAEDPPAIATVKDCSFKNPRMARKRGREEHDKQPGVSKEAKRQPKLPRRQFKEDTPDFQQAVHLKRLQEAQGYGRRAQDVSKGSEVIRGNRTITAGESGFAIEEQSQDDSSVSKPGITKVGKVGKNGEEPKSVLSSQEPRQRNRMHETAADVGSEGSDLELKDKLALEKKRRGKRKATSCRKLLDGDREVVATSNASKGFATALETILSRQLNQSPVAGKAPILSEAPEIYEELLSKKKSERAAKRKQAERKTLRDRWHKPIDALDADYERSLKKIATKGVVKLFNTIVQLRRKAAGNMLEGDDEEVETKRYSRIKKRRDYQRSRQRIKILKARRNHLKKSGSKRLGEDFGDGARMKAKGDN